VIPLQLFGAGADEKDVFTRSSAPVVLTIGLVLACVAGLAACVEVAALDRGAVEGDAARLVTTGQVESSLRPRAAAVLAAVAPAGSTLGGDPDAAAEQMLRDPAFTAAFAGALGSVSRHVFDGETGPIQLDPTLVHTAAVTTLSTLDPTTAGLAGADPGPTVALDTDAIPSLSGAPAIVRLVGTVSGVLGLILIVVGLALSEKRIRAFGRVGRWIAGAGVFVLLAFWLVPRFALPLVGGWTEVAGVVISSGNAFLLPGLVLVAIGVAVSVSANRLIALGRDHTLSVVPKAPMRRTTPADKNWRNSA
jgi:hypothetical protein